MEFSEWVLLVIAVPSGLVLLSLGFVTGVMAVIGHEPDWWSMLSAGAFLAIGGALLLYLAGTHLGIQIDVTT